MFVRLGKEESGEFIYASSSGGEDSDESEELNVDSAARGDAVSA